MGTLRKATNSEKLGLSEAGFDKKPPLPLATILLIHI